MPSLRTRRVADLLGREIASIIQRDIKDPRIGFLTVTGSDVSPDLKSAKIYYTVLGDEEKRAEAAAALEKAKGFIRREVGMRIELKSVPEIRFIYDDTLDRGLRIERLLGGKGDGQGSEG